MTHKEIAIEVDDQDGEIFVDLHTQFTTNNPQPHITMQAVGDHAVMLSPVTQEYQDEVLSNISYREMKIC